MSIITDACSLVNAVKVGLAPAMLEDPCMRLVVGPVVTSEVWDSVPRGAQVIPLELVTQLDDEIPGNQLVAFMDLHKLGPGESECIILAQRDGYIVLSDDRRARQVATMLLGVERVVGTLGMALTTCERGLILSETVREGYLGAIENGAFLPNHSRDSFEEAAANCRVWPCGPDCTHIQDPFRP